MAPRRDVVAVFLLYVIGSSIARHLFIKLLPEIMFCFNFVHLGNYEEIESMIDQFPSGIKTNQQRCFLRCLLRIHGVFMDDIGNSWNVKNAYNFLMSFRPSVDREPYVKSAIFFCARKKRRIVGPNGCRNAFNLFVCFFRHGISFKDDKQFLIEREEFILNANSFLDNSPNSTDSNTTVPPTLKERPEATLSKIIYDDEDKSDHEHVRIGKRATTMMLEANRKHTSHLGAVKEGNDVHREEKFVGTGEGGDYYSEDEDGYANIYHDNPLIDTASKPYQRPSQKLIL